MSALKVFIEKWKNDYDFKTLMTALGTLCVTVAFAIYNGFLGVRHLSLWHGSICVYYLVISLLRGFIVISEKIIASHDDKERKIKRTYIISSALLLVLNISLIVPISLMVTLQKPVNMTLIPAITVAAYTTYKIIAASFNLAKRKKTADKLIKLLRTIGFIDALVSVLTLQNTLIMVNSKGEDISLLPLSAVTSAAAIITAVVLSVVALVKGVSVTKSQ